MNFAFKICIYHSKTQILYKYMLKKRYFHNNLLRINIKLYDTANFMEEIQAKPVLGCQGAKPPRRYKNLH